MRNVLFALSTLIFLQSANAAEIPLKNIQLRCTVDNTSTTVVVGNDGEIADLETEVLLYAADILTDRSEASMSIKKLDANRNLLNISAGIVEIESTIYSVPFAWYAAKVGGQTAKCYLDPLFYQVMKF